MKGRVLKVLMWKHCVVRKRRYLHTPMEFLAPIIIFILLFMFRDKFNPDQLRDHSHEKYFADVERPEALSLNDVGKPPVVLYTPNTPKTRELMNSVAVKFDKTSRRRTTFTPFENDDDIFNYTKQMEYDEAIVIFQNMSRETWPQALNYTIRMKNAFMTGLHQSLDDNAVPHSGFGSIYEKFMVLQWAIDTSYLELLTDSEINQNVTLQEFPYVRVKGSGASSLVCDYMRPLCWLSLLLNFVFLMTRLLEERSSGIQELLKMMGVSTNKLAISHILNVAGPGILFSVLGAVLLTVSSNPLLKESSGFLIFVTLALYYMTIVSFAFAASYLTKSMQYAVSLSVLTYVLLWLPASMLMKRDIGSEVMYLAGLLPHVPMIWVWTEASMLELIGQGLTFSTMFEKHSGRSGSVFAGFILLIIQAIFFFLLAWYLDHVKPGKYGQALPWNFLCQSHYWRKNDVTPNSELEQLEEADDYDQQYFQPVPPDLEVGIRVLNVSKVFPKHVALRDVSLDVHRGEITVLLGHNGAGKTTLMSIITGMLSASSGQVFVNGVELRTAREAVRRRVGLCPQHNLFFNDLTVLEHVMLFTLFKKGTFEEARESSEKLLDKLGILDKKNNMSGELSGGMKRRLQLACALAGDADVLILDEPTSGLDVETRRELWNLLLALRGSRTVLLSTHFMEEADALGDRVAALHQGRVRCYATPLYLKKAIGTGYRLTFTTNGVPNENAITRVVTSHVPDATVKESSLNSISYNLPATASSNFPKLFASLEEKRSELAIVSIGVGVSTLEEVFLRVTLQSWP